MKYFITGGAGFIGSHLVDKLSDIGAVTVYDNLSSGKKEFIQHHLGKNGFHLIQANLLDLDSLKQAIKGSDVVVHLAANPDARRGIENTRLDLELETIATFNVLEAMRVNGIKRILFASSGTIYGETPIVPLSEDHGPALPISLYGAGKLASEGLISAFCGTFDFQTWIFRFANIVGDRATHGVILDFIEKLKCNPTELEILGDGTQSKPYLHVGDCVEGIVFGFQHSNKKINVFNLGCPSQTSVSTIAEMLVEEAGLKEVLLRYTGGTRGWPGDVPQVKFNVGKMSKLGWKASRTSDEAVRKAIREILKERFIYNGKPVPPSGSA
ncbi:MAG: NAD-dependent epimerase/dehydratase family protein [Chloroflexi bacterium]|nr:NAD-dependent epimerase/dehydratase family protein [Chloroflexota bacterium]